MWAGSGPLIADESIRSRKRIFISTEVGNIANAAWLSISVRIESEKMATGPETCPQCTVQGQMHFCGMDSIGMSVQCPNGHLSTVNVKFKIIEITIIDAVQKKVIRYDKFQEPEKTETRAH